MNAARKPKKVDVDERGRITLPKKLRQGVVSFSVKALKDGTLHLVPQKVVSLNEAELLESLKKSILEFKRGKTHKVPPDWIE